MDALRVQLAKIQEQVGALSASQKMLAISLLAIMVLTLLFWSRYAGTADMEAVLDQALSSDEIGRIQGELRKMGIQFKVTGDRVLVQSDRKLEALAGLSYAQAMPQNTRSAYDEIIKRISPWSSQSDNDATRNDAKASLLGQLIRMWPDVTSASVVIDPTNERRIGDRGRQPRASVLITTNDPKNRRKDRSLVEAAAATVAGAQSGLDLSQVTVVVNGVKHNVNDPDSMGIGNADEILTRQQDNEKFYADKIAKQLEYVQAPVLVSVTVDLNVQSEVKHEEKYDPKGIAKSENAIESESTEETAPAQPAAEPGAVSNSGMQLGSPPTATGGAGSTRERNNTTFDSRFSVTQTDTKTMAGKAKVIAAAVRVPRSYFVNLFKINNGAGSTKDPDDKMLEPVYAIELVKMRNEVKKCTAIANDADIQVEPYPDALPLMAVGTTIVSTQPGSTGGVSTMLLGHYKEFVLAGLALVSLFVVSSIVKKSAPAPLIPAPAMELGEAPALASDEDMAGEVGEGRGNLDAMELDEDTIKAQQMVEQVSTMVKENPDGAANLVKRWLNRS